LTTLAAAAKFKQGGVAAKKKRLFGADLVKHLEEQKRLQGGGVEEAVEKPKTQSKWKLVAGKWTFNQEAQQQVQAQTAGEARSTAQRKFEVNKVEQMATVSAVKRLKAGRECQLCRREADTEECVLVNDSQVFHLDCFTCKGCNTSLGTDGAQSVEYSIVLSKMWHPGCIKCTVCSCALDSGVYGYDGMPHCETHVLERRGMKCAGCGQVAKGQVVLDTKGNQFHPECFCCVVCKVQLSDFFEKDGKAYCSNDFVDNFGEECSLCGEKIASEFNVVDNVEEADGLKWHPSCFTCCVCSTQLIDDVYFYEGKLYCQKDLYDTFLDKCARCNDPIRDQCIRALEQKWHKGCFTCKVCQTPITGAFMTRDGQPYCKEDYSKTFAEKCDKCGEAITAMCIAIGGKKVHPQCFRCFVCDDLIEGSFLKGADGNPRCHKKECSQKRVSVTPPPAAAAAA